MATPQKPVFSSSRIAAARPRAFSHSTELTWSWRGSTRLKAVPAVEQEALVVCAVPGPGVPTRVLPLVSGHREDTVAHTFTL